MKIVISGGSGFIGGALTKSLLARGHEVFVLSRNPDKVRTGRGVQWDGRNQGPWSEIAASADVIINLAGENVGAGRWSEERKQRLVNTRLDSTNAVVTAMKSAPSQRRTFVSASAVGYYGMRGDEELREDATRGSGFLAELVEKWESAARQAESLSRLVLPRFGVALAGDGGALRKMMLPFHFGMGGPVGSGQQWLSWIDREDAVRIVEWAIDNQSARGVYNATAPNPVRNRDFARTLGKVMRRPSFMPTPGFVLELMLGQMADEVLLGGQRVIPARLAGEGFTFAYPNLEQSLRHALMR